MYQFQGGLGDVWPVIFRTWPDGGVIALLPTERESDGSCSSYMHVGQHAAANPRHVIRKTRPATPEEYKPLKEEMEAEPYNYQLVVYKRMQKGW